jgi:hypothetical protein
MKKPDEKPDEKPKKQVAEVADFALERFRYAKMREKLEEKLGRKK